MRLVQVLPIFDYLGHCEPTFSLSQLDFLGRRAVTKGGRACFL